MRSKGVMTVAAKFCLKCGHENDSERGACLLCYAPLGQSGAGAACPQCGTDNPGEASFCQACGTALVEGVAAVPSLAVGAALVVEALAEGVVGGVETELAEPDLVGGEMADLAEEVVGRALGPEELEPSELVQPAETEVEYVPPAPGVVELEEPEPAAVEEFAPPPPPGAIELEEAEPEVAAEEEFAPPPPPGALELEEEPAAEQPEEPGGWHFEAEDED